ncbi:MAG: L-threonylcarbamoyladenylate synthase [bacterium]|nr:L-threonylcarbamoyladenylate synthase [bacterium]
MNKDIQKATQILRDGGIVIFPTDTAFGIGCRIDDKKAVERLFKIRKRPLTQATPVLVDSVEMVQEYISSMPSEVKNKLMKKYWPGALTIILPCRIDRVPSLVRGGGKTLGVRMPDNKIIRKIISGVGVPILGPSANFHGEKTPYRLEDLDPKLIKLVDYVFQGHPLQGQAFLPSPSTVIDCSVKPWRILRQGAISIQNSKFKIQNYNSKVKSQTILFIDTSDNKKIEVALEISGKRFNKREKIGRQKAQIVLPLIQELLKKHKLKLIDLNGIKVNTGPGSFMGIRVGIAIANALSFALKIPRY